MAKQIGKGREAKWVDPEGNEIPVKYIDKDVVKRDKSVVKIFKHVEHLAEMIEKEKSAISSLIRDYLKEIADKYNQDWKGNTTLYDFSQELRVDVSISNNITFSEKLQIAKGKIDNCVKRWSESSDDKVKAVIERAFKTDKKGNLDTKMILKLRGLKFKDAEWKEAMELISDAIIVASTKEYFTFARKKDKGAWENVSLNFSAY